MTTTTPSDGRKGVHWIVRVEQLTPTFGPLGFNIQIQHDNSRPFPSGYPDVGVWPFLPPAGYLPLAGGRIQHTLCRPGVFATARALRPVAGTLCLDYVV